MHYLPSCVILRFLSRTLFEDDVLPREGFLLGVSVVGDTRLPLAVTEGELCVIVQLSSLGISTAGYASTPAPFLEEPVDSTLVGTCTVLTAQFWIHLKGSRDGEIDDVDVQGRVAMPKLFSRVSAQIRTVVSLRPPEACPGVGSPSSTSGVSSSLSQISSQSLCS